MEQKAIDLGGLRRGPFQPGMDDVQFRSQDFRHSPERHPLDQELQGQHHFLSGGAQAIKGVATPTAEGLAAPLAEKLLNRATSGWMRAIGDDTSEPVLPMPLPLGVEADHTPERVVGFSPPPSYPGYHLLMTRIGKSGLFIDDKRVITENTYRP